MFGKVYATLQILFFVQRAMGDQQKVIKLVYIIVGFMFRRDYSGCTMRMSCRRSESTEEVRQPSNFYQSLEIRRIGVIMELKKSWI